MVHFVTLTYSPYFLPRDGNVRPRDLQLFLKRLRHFVAPARVRYYGVGEYGDLSLRPHYHLALYGVRALDHQHGAPCCCRICVAWGQGWVGLDQLNESSAAYIISYVTKRLTRTGDPRLGGRHPEFARMSRKPGLGADAMDVVEKAVTTRAGAAYMSREGDVPNVVRFQKGMWPLGRYLRGKLRLNLGLDSGVPEEVLVRHAQQLQAELREPGARAAREDKRAHVARRAVALDGISRSKKGVGL